MDIFTRALKGTDHVQQLHELPAAELQVFRAPEHKPNPSFKPVPIADLFAVPTSASLAPHLKLPQTKTNSSARLKPNFNAIAAQPQAIESLKKEQFRQWLNQELDRSIYGDRSANNAQPSDGMLEAVVVSMPAPLFFKLPAVLAVVATRGAKAVPAQATNQVIHQTLEAVAEFAPLKNALEQAQKFLANTHKGNQAHHLNQVDELISTVAQFSKQHSGASVRTHAGFAMPPATTAAQHAATQTTQALQAIKEQLKAIN